MYMLMIDKSISLLKSGIKKFKELFCKYWYVILGIFLIISASLFFVYKENKEPKIIPQEVLTNEIQLAKEIKVEEKVAKEIVQEIEKSKPKDSYYVVAENVEVAAEIVEDQIERDDPSIPELAREKTDRTVITPITKDKEGKPLKEKEQRVDIYKIDLEKRVRIKAGVMVEDDRAYPTIGLEYNRLELLYNKKATTVMWTLAKF